jgi:hypothetical protein
MRDLPALLELPLLIGHRVMGKRQFSQRCDGPSRLSGLRLAVFKPGEVTEIVDLGHLGHEPKKIRLVLRLIAN